MNWRTLIRHLIPEWWKQGQSLKQAQQTLKTAQEARA